MLLIVGKSADGQIAGMNKEGEFFGTLTPNYIGNNMDLVVSFATYSTDSVILKIEGGRKIDGNIVAFSIVTATGAIINMAWDDGVTAYVAVDQGLFDKLQASMNNALEFVFTSFSPTAVNTGTNPPPAPPSDDDCDTTPNRHWSKPDLIEYANNNGIDITGLTKKADILAAILGE